MGSLSSRYLLQISFFSLSLIFIFFLTCSTGCKESVTDPPPEEKPPGYQEDIPWPSLADSPWPKHRHDPQNTGRSKFAGPSEGNLVWGIVDSLDNYNEIVLKDSAFFVSSIYGNLHSYNLSGSLNWKRKFALFNPHFKISTTPLITADDKILLADMGNIYCIDSAGETIWSYATGKLIDNTGINIDKEGNVYFLDESGGLYSLSSNGNLNWLYQDNRFWSNNDMGIAMSPDGRTIYFAGRDISLFAFDIKNKQLLWSIDKGMVRSSPMVDCQGNIYFTAFNEYSGKFYSITPEGIERFCFEYTKVSFNANDPTIDKDGNLYFTGDSLYSLDYTGKLRWKISLPYINTSPLSCDKDGNIYVGTNDSKLLSISNTGSIRWIIQLNTGGNWFSPVIGNGFILYNLNQVFNNKIIFYIK